MSDIGRRTDSTAERAEIDAIKQSLQVSSYLDEVMEAIHSGAPPKVTVPNLKEPTKGEVLSEVMSETHGAHMDLDSLGGTGLTKTASASAPAPLPAPLPSHPRFVVSRNQAMALKKYPTLIEFLGQPHGEKIAKQILQQMNLLIAEAVNKNSKEANERAVVCKADRQNLKQYFRGDGWICRVTASGPFGGDEAIYYSKKKDLVCVLRKSEEDGKIKYADVSDQFNLIYEAEEGDLTSALECENVERPVEKTASAEREENNNFTKETETSVVETETG